MQSENRVMSDIFVTIRNQNQNAMTSIDGVVFVAILQQDGTLLAQKPVNLRYADAQFANLEIGQYTIIFIYLEPERQLLKVRINRFPLDFSTY